MTGQLSQLIARQRGQELLNAADQDRLRHIAKRHKPAALAQRPNTSRGAWRPGRVTSRRAWRLAISVGSSGDEAGEGAFIAWLPTLNRMAL